MTIFEMSMSGGLLIAVILLLRRLLLHRVPKWTFLLLWAAALCRLLIPFSLPSQFSVYTGTERMIQALQQEDEVPAHFDASPSLSVTVHSPAVVVPPVISPPTIVTPALPEPEEPLSPGAVLYVTGAALCGLFFGTAYLWSLRRFWGAVPADRSFIRRWQEAHSTLFPIRVRVSRAVNAPLAYGLFRPVVLLPETTDWSDEGQLTYILTHEYIHIRRGDLFWKLLLVAALCVHWCNPLVWAMYFCANRDLELACDEAVIRVLGLNSRKGYALSLLSAAESGFFPLCTTYNSKNQTEERIRAIMKTKKQSLAAILIAALLVTSVTAVFATSKAPPEDLSGLPPAVQTNSDPKPAPGDTSVPTDRVHPTAPGDTSAPTAPGDTSAPTAPGDTSIPDGRVHPVTGQPGDAQADTPKEPAQSSAYPVNSKGQTYGISSIVAPEYNIPDLINVPFLKDGESDPSVACYVLREDAAPYRYPGEINNPDDAMDYMAWLEKQAYSVTLPAYDKEGNSLGTTEVILNDGVKVDTSGKDLETAREEVKNNRWGVPYGEIPQWTEFTVTDSDDGRELGKYLEEVCGLYPGDYTFGHFSDGTCSVQVHYLERRLREELPGGVYPVNSKGQTYGSVLARDIVGYEPDLCAVGATNGASGYVKAHDLHYCGYPGPVKTVEEWNAFIEWQEAQPRPIKIPVYDVNYEKVVGSFEFDSGKLDTALTEGKDLETVREMEKNNR